MLAWTLEIRQKFGFEDRFLVDCVQNIPTSSFIFMQSLLHADGHVLLNHFEILDPRVSDTFAKVFWLKAAFKGIKQGLGHKL